MSKLGRHLFPIKDPAWLYVPLAGIVVPVLGTPLVIDRRITQNGDARITQSIDYRITNKPFTDNG